MRRLLRRSPGIARISVYPNNRTREFNRNLTRRAFHLQQLTVQGDTITPEFCLFLCTYLQNLVELTILHDVFRGRRFTEGCNVFINEPLLIRVLRLYNIARSVLFIYQRIDEYFPVLSVLRIDNCQGVNEHNLGGLTLARFSLDISPFLGELNRDLIQVTVHLREGNRTLYFLHIRGQETFRPQDPPAPQEVPTEDIVIRANDINDLELYTGDNGWSQVINLRLDFLP